ncbi:MAG: DNA polymerase IV [Anaerolineales bacterium]|jgi:DNA polymerase-4
MSRKILHLDLDAFFCAVEEHRDPSLEGTPFAVGGKPEQRGVVASCSYAARQYGIRSAMSMAKALNLYPQLRIVRSHMSIYQDVANQVMETAHKLTPLVERISIDEAFLDVSSLPNSGIDVAIKLQKNIRTEFNLPCSFGVATNKLLAKIANDVGKADAQDPNPPNAITNVPPGEEASFLKPLPVQMLWGIGPRTAARLEILGITTIGELASRPEAELVNIFGKLGKDLAQRSKGIDNRPVVTSHEAKSISQETTFPKDIQDQKELFKILRRLSEGVGLRLRKVGLGGSTVKIKIRWSDFTTVTRQVTLNRPTNLDQEIYQAALNLFSSFRGDKRPVRLLGVGISNLGSMARQLHFWGGDSEKEQRLQNAIDVLRSQYGKNVLHRGRITDK